MNKPLLAALMLAATGAAYAQMPSATEIMKRADKNMDGIITKEEAAGTPMVDFFDMFDLNGDGKITLAELKSAIGEPADPPSPSAPPAPTPPAAPAPVPAK